VFREGAYRSPVIGPGGTSAPTFYRESDEAQWDPIDRNSTGETWLGPSFAIDLCVFFSTEGRILRFLPRLGALQMHAFFFKDLS
jgi:hypothetical protein